MKWQAYRRPIINFGVKQTTSALFAVPTSYGMIGMIHFATSRGTWLRLHIRLHIRLHKRRLSNRIKA